jgi:hypothetical protein
MVEINAGKPVYIQNGIQITEAQMNQLDPSTIERVDVLNGEKAINTYGEPGKNGVVTITTKTQNQTRVNSASIQTVNIKPVKVSTSTGVIANSVNVNSNINIAPLYVVNKQKVNVETVNKIQVDAIVSVNVLTDKDAVKNYGEEGKNGVVEITTKKTATVNR